MNELPEYPRRQRTVYPNDWRRIRARILERDAWTCMAPRHHPDCRGFADTVDHIVPISRGGSHGDFNLRAAFGKCNASMGGKLNRKHDTLPRARVSRWSR